MWSSTSSWGQRFCSGVCVAENSITLTEWKISLAQIGNHFTRKRWYVNRRINLTKKLPRRPGTGPRSSTGVGGIAGGITTNASSTSSITTGIGSTLEAISSTTSTTSGTSAGGTYPSRTQTSQRSRQNTGKRLTSSSHSRSSSWASSGRSVAKAWRRRLEV